MLVTVFEAEDQNRIGSFYLYDVHKSVALLFLGVDFVDGFPEQRYQRVALRHFAIRLRVSGSLKGL